MKKLQSLHWFLASASLWTLRSNAAMPPAVPTVEPDSQDPVKLRTLNQPGENLFAGHRSHSSHSSHRSSSGGGYSAPARTPYIPPEPAPRPAPAPYVPAAPRPTPTSPNNLLPGPNQPVDPGRPAAVSPQPAPSTATQPPPALTLAEKRRLQIMRVQIALTSLGIYTGAVNGVLTDETKDAIKRIQIIKGLPDTGLMTTETLNALGVPAVQ